MPMMNIIHSVVKEMNKCLSHQCNDTFASDIFQCSQQFLHLNTTLMKNMNQSELTAPVALAAPFAPTATCPSGFAIVAPILRHILIRLSGLLQNYTTHWCKICLCGQQMQAFNCVESDLIGPLLNMEFLKQCNNYVTDFFSHFTMTANSSKLRRQASFSIVCGCFSWI